MPLALSRSSTTPLKTLRDNSTKKNNSKSRCLSRSGFFFLTQHAATLFHFKQFSIEDTGATMKVGTDAVLLGASVSPSVEPTRILDIGTGCGILALMMAQRFSNAIIDAIDIDAPSVAIASENILLSPWANRVQSFKTSLQDFAANRKQEYSLIISNPPYFSNSLRSGDPQKSLARHDDTLPPTLLFNCSSRILRSHGEIWIIVPSSEQEKFDNAAKETNLYLTSTLNICTATGKSPKLSILSFSDIASSAKETTYYIRDQKNQYTTWYKQLTQPFLL